MVYSRVRKLKISIQHQDLYSNTMIQEYINVMSSTICKIGEFYRIATKTPTNDEEEEMNIQFAYQLLYFTYHVFTADYHLMRSYSRLAESAFYMLMALLSITGYLYYGVILSKGHIVFDIGECFTVWHSLAVHSAVWLMRPIYLKFYDHMYIKTFDYISTFKPRFNTIHFGCAKKINFDRLIGKNYGMNTGNIYKKKNVIDFLLWVPMVAMLGAILSLLHPPFNYILKYGNSFPTIQDYYTLFPLYNHIESPIIYWVVTILISIFGLFTIYVGFFGLFCTSTIQNIMKYNALIISEKIHLLSLNFIYEYEKIKGVKGKGYNWNIIEKRLLTAFDKDLVQLLQQYQEFSRYARIIESFMNIYLTLVIAVVPVGGFAVIAHMMMVKTDIFQKLRNIFSLITMMCSLFTFCSIAKTFEDVGEICRYAVYNLPWYYLPPKTRKLVNIFQCMVHDHPTLKVLGVYPANMSLFPSIWSKIYSCANLVRTTTKH